MSARIRVNGRDEQHTAATVAELLRARGIEGSRDVWRERDEVEVRAEADTQAR